MLTLTAMEPAVPTFAPTPDSDFEFLPVPQTVSYIFTPYAPSLVTVSVETQSMYYFGLTPLRGQFGPGASTVINVASMPVTPPAPRTSTQARAAARLC